MKKERLLLVLLLVTVMLIPLNAYSAGIGKVETIGKGKLAVSENTDIAFDRDMKAKNTSTTATYTAASATLNYSESTIVFTNPIITENYSETDRPDIDRLTDTGAQITYGLLDNLDVYLNLGWIDGKIKGGSYQYNFTGTATNYSINNVNYGAIALAFNVDGTWKNDLKGGFLYGVGTKINLPLKDDLILGADISYSAHRNSYSGTETYTISGGSTGSGTYSWKGKMFFQEFQFAPYIAKKISNFTPYLGVKYDYYRLRDKSDTSKTTYKGDDNFGIFVGSDYKINDALFVNLEGRFINETAMSIGVGYKF